MYDKYSMFAAMGMAAMVEGGRMEDPPKTDRSHVGIIKADLVKPVKPKRKKKKRVKRNKRGKK